MIAVRLEPELEKSIDRLSMSEGISKSEFVRRSVMKYIQDGEKQNPYEAGKHLFGKFSSGRSDLSEKSESIFREKMRAKRS